MDAVTGKLQRRLMMDWFSFVFGLAVGMLVMALIFAYIISRY